MRVLVTGAVGCVGRNRVRFPKDQPVNIALDRACAELPADRRIEGNLDKPSVRGAAFFDPVDVVVHFATVAAGAVEEALQASWAANVNGSSGLMQAARNTDSRPRVVFTSNIAMLGAPLPGPVHNWPQLRPHMLNDAHKAMSEQSSGNLGTARRLAGAVAQAAGHHCPRSRRLGHEIGLLSDVFYALSDGRRWTSPVSQSATL